MNSTNISYFDYSPPTPLAWDYIQIGFFASMVLLGVPLNVYGLGKTLLNRRSTTSSKSMEILKIHLSITDLMILFFFALSKLIWWSTYEWLGGDVICKMVAFLCTLSFYSNSNLIALIGIIRLMAVKCLTTSAPFYPKKFACYISFVYGLAFLLSTPQLHVWCVYYPFPMFPNWAQCVTIWGVDRWVNPHVASYYEEEIYELVHMLFVFWIPFLVVCFTYLGAWVHLRKNIKETGQSLIEFQNHYNNTVRLSHTQCETDDETSNLTNVNSHTKKTSLNNGHHRSLSVCTLTKAKNIMMKKTTYVLLAYILCWSSYNVVALLEYLSVLESGHWHLLYNLIVLNAVVNPFVYGI